MRRKFACQVIKVLVSPSEIRRLTLAPLIPAFCTSTASSKVTVTSTRSPPPKVSVPSAGREVTLTSVISGPALTVNTGERP